MKILVQEHACGIDSQAFVGVSAIYFSRPNGASLDDLNAANSQTQQAETPQ
jgi:hypothetical protein